jgi:hypothetical protein
MNDYETATGRVVVGSDGREPGRTFPREWGRPPDDYEQRGGWIKAKIRCGEIAREFGEEVRWLGRSSRITVPSHVVARRVAQMRLRLLEVMARWPQ